MWGKNMNNSEWRAAIAVQACVTVQLCICVYVSLSVGQSQSLGTPVKACREQAKGEALNELWENKTKGDRDSILSHFNQSAKKLGLKNV